MHIKTDHWVLYIEFMLPISSWVACMNDFVSSPNLFCRLMKARGPGTAWPGGGASSNWIYTCMGRYNVT